MAESAGTYTIQIVGLTDSAAKSLDNVNRKVRDTSTAAAGAQKSAVGLQTALGAIALPLAAVAAVHRVTAAITEAANAGNVLSESLNTSFNKFTANTTKIVADTKRATAERIAAIKAEAAAALAAAAAESEAISKKYQDSSTPAGAYREIVSEIVGLSKSLNSEIRAETELIKKRAAADIKKVQDQEAALAAELAVQKAIRARDTLEAGAWEAAKRRYAERMKAEEDHQKLLEKTADFEEFVAKDKLAKRLEREKEITREHERQLAILNEQAQTIGGINFSGLGRGAFASVGQARRHLQGRR